MPYVIKDVYTNEYFTVGATTHSWYHPEIYRARIYTKKKFALKTIQNGGHHVIWPGNRILLVVPIRIIEIPIIKA